MYYDHPDDAAAYDVPNQFAFGSELVVAPITRPADRATGLGRVKAWLPPGEWFDVFTGLTYTGGRTVYLHRDLTSIPVLAKAGAILPVTPADGLGPGTDLPEVVEVRVYAGADGEFTLAEDRDDEQWATTRFSYVEETGELTVHEVEGEAATLPTGRRYRVVGFGFAETEPAEVEAGATVRVGSGRADNHVDARVFALLDRAQITYALKASVLDAVSGSPAGEAVWALQALDLDPTLLGAVSEILLARGPE